MEQRPEGNSFKLPPQWMVLAVQYSISPPKNLSVINDQELGVTPTEILLTILTRLPSLLLLDIFRFPNQSVTQKVNTD